MTMSSLVKGKSFLSVLHWFESWPDASVIFIHSLNSLTLKTAVQISFATNKSNDHFVIVQLSDHMNCKVRAAFSNVIEDLPKHYFSDASVFKIEPVAFCIIFTNLSPLLNSNITGTSKRTLF